MRKSYIIKPYGKKWTKVIELHGNDVLRSFIVSATYNGGNVLEFIERNNHIEQFCLQFHEF